MMIAANHWTLSEHWGVPMDPLLTKSESPLEVQLEIQRIVEHLRQGGV